MAHQHTKAKRKDNLGAGGVGLCDHVVKSLIEMFGFTNAQDTFDSFFSFVMLLD